MHQKTFLCVAALVAMFSAQPAHAQSVLFEGGRVIPGDGSPAINNVALLVERGTITRIGGKGDIARPAGGTRVDLGQDCDAGDHQHSRASAQTRVRATASTPTSPMR